MTVVWKDAFIGLETRIDEPDNYFQLQCFVKCKLS